MYQIDSPSHRTRERGGAGGAASAAKAGRRPDRFQAAATGGCAVVDIGPGVATTVREYAAASPGVDGRQIAARAPSVFASLRPHCEQNARWSAFSCAQWRQGRIAVVSLLYPWYRSTWVMVT